jgi:hypothetical protein
MGRGNLGEGEDAGEVVAAGRLLLLGEVAHYVEPLRVVPGGGVCLCPARSCVWVYGWLWRVEVCVRVAVQVARCVEALRVTAHWSQITGRAGDEYMPMLWGGLRGGGWRCK